MPWSFPAAPFMASMRWAEPLPYLRESGRGFAVRDINVPIVPGAVLFDLLNGGDKSFGREPVYWHLGYQARRLGGG